MQQRSGNERRRGEKEDAREDEEDAKEERSTRTRIDVAVEEGGKIYQKTHKKETGEFVFDEGGNIDSVLGAIEEEEKN